MLRVMNNRKTQHNARDWMTTLLGSVGFPPSIVFRRERGEREPKPAWKQFDDTHHWDSTAEEWIPNDLTR